MSPKSSPSPNRSPGDGARILIVEDDAEVARLLQTVLRDFGFEACPCRSAAETRQQLAQQVPTCAFSTSACPTATAWS